MLGDLAFMATDVPATNLIENGDFSKGREGWNNYLSSVEVNDDGIVATPIAGRTIGYFYKITKRTYFANQKLYSFVKVRALDEGVTSVRYSMDNSALGNTATIQSISNPVVNQEYILGGVIKRSSDLENYAMTISFTQN